MGQHPGRGEVVVSAVGSTWTPCWEVHGFGGCVEGDVDVAAGGVHGADLVETRGPVVAAGEKFAAVGGPDGFEEPELVGPRLQDPGRAAVGAYDKDRSGVGCLDGFGGDVEGDEPAVRGPVRVFQAGARWHDLVQPGAVGV